MHSPSRLESSSEGVEVLQKRNQAIYVNPPNANLNLTWWGSSFNWMVFCVMAASLLGVLAWSFVKRRGHRAFHYIFAAVLATSSLAWFSMASDLGATPITVQFLHNSPLGTGIGGYPTRQIWYARYIDWVITAPLLLLSLLLVTGLSLAHIFIVLYFAIFMVVCGLVGALVHTSYKWGYYAFGIFALLYILYHLFVPGLLSARSLGGRFTTLYLVCCAYIASIWWLYALCWGLAEGGNVISVNGEMVFYGILDLLSKPLYCFMFLFMMEACDYSELRLQSGKYSDSAEVPASEGRPMGSSKMTEGATGDIPPSGHGHAAPTQ